MPTFTYYLSAFIIDRFGTEFDLSIFEPQDWVALSEAWANIANAVDSRRKFGVENKGISLLMAYTLESMQSLDRKTQAA